MAHGLRASILSLRRRKEYWGRLHYFTFKGKNVVKFSHKKERMFQKEEFLKNSETELLNTE